MNMTATEAMLHDREMEEAQRVEARYLRFVKDFAPEDDARRAEFEMILRRLMHEVHISALRPFIDAAAREVARTAVTPIYTPPPS